MGRGPKTWDEATIERRRLEGRGQGERESYCPWILVTDFSSRGNSRRVHGLKVNRDHHLLSDGEWHMFLLLEWLQEVEDIREQFPLDRDLTQEIAAALGIRHPCYPRTRVPAVLTADLLVTQRRQGKRALAAFNVKLESEAEDPGSMEKLEIQRAYFDGAGIPHHLVFKERLPLTKVRNLEWIRGAEPKQGEIEPYPGHLAEMASRMATDLKHRNSDAPLAEYCADFDVRCGLEPGTGLRVARLLMQSRVLLPDLNCENLAQAPLVAFGLAAPVGRLQLVEAS